MLQIWNLGKFFFPFDITHSFLFAQHISKYYIQRFFLVVGHVGQNYGRNVAFDFKTQTAKK